MKSLKIPEFWEVLHHWKCATDCFFLETLHIEQLLSYHGNRYKNELEHLIRELFLKNY